MTAIRQTAVAHNRTSISMMLELALALVGGGGAPAPPVRLSLVEVRAKMQLIHPPNLGGESSKNPCFYSVFWRSLPKFGG